MTEDDGTAPWERLPPPGDPVQAVRAAIAAVRAAPTDEAARKRLRALGTDEQLWDPLVVLLADEARAAADRPAVAAAFYEELADLYENLDQPLEMIASLEALVRVAPGDVEHSTRLAWQYRRAGANVKAAEAFEHVARLATDDRARAALRAAGTLYRDAGRLERAAEVYREIVDRRDHDLEAWRALEQIFVELARWADVAHVRGELAARASGVDKAVLLRAQARALEQSGDEAAAAALVTAAAQHAPDDISGLVDYASVLAREGRPRDAANVLEQRIRDSVADGAPLSNVAALRLRHIDLLAECGDHGAATEALDELLAAVPDYAPARDRLLEAARRHRASGDLRAAIRAYERAAELGSDHNAFAAELASVRTAHGVQLAAADATAGDTASAERQLRAILQRDRMHLDANLALADVLVTTGRARDALGHLDATLAAAPHGGATEPLGRLVFKQAQIARELGDVDGAHRLLHDAHQLARRDLEITLALGESCFGRKLWREAAIHLGSLATHPDAHQHAARVAAGLVRAGQAEVRALKPANAERHYEAAVVVDPQCAPAWHHLAELATTRGDLARAADCFEHEAAATVELAARVRMYDAVGDLCRDVLGDVPRAERCWAAVETAGSAHVLEKLLAVQRARGAVLERGETCERLAAAIADRERAKALTAEAAEAFAEAGDLARARAVADYLAEQHPHDVPTALLAARIAVAQHDAAAAAGILRRAVTGRGERDADPRLAEVFRALGDAEKSRGNERAALEAYQRAVMSSPETEVAVAARRALIELAAAGGRRANTTRLELLEASQSPEDVIATARELAASGPEHAHDARLLFELARALGVQLTVSEELRLTAYRARPMAADEAYAGVLDDSDRRSLVDDAGDTGLLAGLFALVGEALALVAPDAKTALADRDLVDARRPPAGSDAAAIAIYPQIAKALAGPVTLLYATPSPSVPDVQVVLATSPVVVIGPRLASVRARSRTEVDVAADAELRFQLGRIVELSRPHRVLAAGVDRESLVTFVSGLVHAFGPRTATPMTASVIREANRLHDVLPVAMRRRVSERLAGLTASDLSSLDPASYLATCERAADRSGLIACGDIGVAIRAAGGVERARHLIELAATQRYLASQRRLRRVQ